MIELRGVAKRYDSATAVGPCDLTAREGEVTVLLGPSGCGKSTLLRLMIGLLAADEGSVWLAGEQLSASNVRQLRHRIGYVIQDGGLFPHLTAHANVTLLAHHLGREEGAIEARVEELTRLVHLPPAALARYPAELSGGQRQRVGLMRALMLDPDMLLLDEPLGALDPLIRADLQEQLRDIFQQLHKTVVMVTHDLAEAGHFAHQVVLMRAGSIEQRGPMQQLLEAPATPFVERFIRAQGMGVGGGGAMTRAGGGALVS